MACVEKEGKRFGLNTKTLEFLETEKDPQRKLRRSGQQGRKKQMLSWSHMTKAVYPAAQKTQSPPYWETPVWGKNRNSLKLAMKGSVLNVFCMATFYSGTVP